MIDWDKEDDEQLLIAARGDADAFSAFYRRYETAVLLYFRRRLGSELAADLTAEVFAAVLISLPRYRPGEAPPQAWLFGIARHKLASSQRRRVVEDNARRRLRMAPLVLAGEDLERIDGIDSDSALSLR
ncbi:MAG: RNA polymerase sigma factor [Solirubrobacteraceae bacterium]